MVELIGLEDLDLVMMLLEKRETSNQIVSSFLWGWFEVAWLLPAITLLDFEAASNTFGQ